MKLNVIDSLPGGFLEVEPSELGMILKGPTLIRLQGRQDPPLFVTTLLHGDETTGFLALQKLLKGYRADEDELPRSLWVFLGNIEAAKCNVRHLPNQPDYNRIWNGGSSPENLLAAQLLDKVKEKGVFASIDIHNTSGKNPHYACVNSMEPHHLSLGRLFSRTLVYFTRPGEVLSKAFSALGPSVTVESGKAGDLFGVDHVVQFLEKIMGLGSIPETDNGHGELNIFHSIARILVPPQSRIGFDQDCSNVDFCFLENLDVLNFSEQPVNTLIGWRGNPDLELSVVDEQGREVGRNYIDYLGSEIRLKRAVVPSMFTTSAKAVHQDCLGYLMERYSFCGKDNG